MLFSQHSFFSNLVHKVFPKEAGSSPGGPSGNGPERAMESSLIYGISLGKAVTQSSCINNQKPDIFGSLDLEEPHLHHALEHNARENNIIS